MAGSLRLVEAPDVYELRVYVGRDSSGHVKHRYDRFIGNKRSAQARPRRTRNRGRAGQGK